MRFEYNSEKNNNVSNKGQRAGYSVSLYENNNMDLIAYGSPSINTGENVEWNKSGSVSKRLHRAILLFWCLWDNAIANCFLSPIVKWNPCFYGEKETNNSAHQRYLMK